MRTHPIVASLAVIATAAMTACAAESTSSSPTARTEAVPVVAGAAKLDRDAAVVRLPLDDYGMDARGQQLAAAATQIVFARCVTGSAEVGAATLNDARASLAAAPDVSHWLFGYWDAEYLAAHGIRDGRATTSIGNGLDDVDPSKAKKCVASEDALSIEPIATTYQSQLVQTQALSGASVLSWEKAVADPRFQQLARERDQCVAAKGYVTSQESKLGGVRLDPAWSAEEKLKAALAEATCADQLELTQRAADLQAAYQRQIIDQNQAEFVLIRKLAEERVKKAEALLEEAGVM